MGTTVETQARGRKTAHERFGQGALEGQGSALPSFLPLLFASRVLVQRRASPRGCYGNAQGQQQGNRTQVKGRPMQETIRHSLCGSGPFLGRAIMVPYTRAAQQNSTWEKKTTVQEFSTPWASSTWWHAIGASQAFGTRGASPWELSLKQRSWESVYPGTQQPAGQTNKNRQGVGKRELPRPMA